MNANNPTLQVNLTVISPLAEIVIRSGDLTAPTVKQQLIHGYGQFIGRPGVFGLSVVFHQGYDVDALAKAAHFPNGKIGYSVIAHIQDELANLQGEYAMVLFITPTRRYADHHTLGITRSGQIETNLQDDVADALLRAFTVVSNPYKGQP